MDAETKTKYIYTAAHYYCFIACGLCFSIFNPTLIDLKDVFNTSLKEASFVFPIRSAGYVIGTLSCGVVTTLFDRQLVLIIVLILKSGTIALVPHYRNVYQFYANAVFNGFFTAGIDTTVNVWVNEMWGTDGSPYMQALHFFFGIGAILGPILSEPFLSPIHQNNTNFNYNEFIAFGNSSGDAFESKLYIPYSISAMTAILSSVIFFVLYILRPYHSPQPIDTNDDRQQLVDENTSSTIRSKFECPNRSTIWMITISGLFLLLYAGTETAYFTFSASYVTRTDLHLTKNTGAYMASVLALSFTITRALSILIAIKMSPQLMIYMDCLILVCGYIIIFIFANTNQTFLWMGNILLGIGFASVFPSYYPFIEGSLRISNMIGSIFLFCSGLSSCICPLIVGLFIETKPLMLIYMNFSLTLLTIIALIVLHITVKVRSKTHNPNETEIEQTEE